MRSNWSFSLVGSWRTQKSMTATEMKLLGEPEFIQFLQIPELFFLLLLSLTS